MTYSELYTHIAHLRTCVSLDEIVHLMENAKREHVLSKLKKLYCGHKEVFKGFTIHEKNWQLIAKKLPLHAQECHLTFTALLDAWWEQNFTLSERIEREVHAESLEDDLLPILSDIDSDEKTRYSVYWALLLDRRQDIQYALVHGLRDALADPSSPLMTKVEKCKLARELEHVKQDMSNLQAERDDLKKQCEEIPLLQAKLHDLHEALSVKMQNEQVPLLQARMHELCEALRQEEERRKEQENATQEERRQHDAAQEEFLKARKEMTRLRAELGSTRAQNHELQNMAQKRDDALKQQQNRVYEIEQQFSEQIKRLESDHDEIVKVFESEHDDMIKQLENERREVVRLRSALESRQPDASKAEQERALAYEKRDEERDKREALEARMERMERSKQTLIQEKRELHMQIEQCRLNLTELHEKLAQSEHTISVLYSEKQHLHAELEQTLAFTHASRAALTGEKNAGMQTAAALAHYDDVWDQAVTQAASHLALDLSGGQSAKRSSRPEEMWEDWQAWQRTEETFVHSLLHTLPAITAEDLANSEIVQKILALRWYLLEWLKLGMLETLYTNNRCRNQGKPTTTLPQK